MKRNSAPLALLLILAFVLSACGATNNQSAIETGIAQTLQISQLETLAAGAGGAPVATADGGGQAAGPTNTLQPSETPTITMTFTPSVPMVSVSQDTNCRRGPSINYGLITTILVGQQVQVLKTFSNSYAVVQNPNGSGDCWLYLQYANTTDFSAYGLAAATQPPTPTATFTATPSFDWTGSWNVKAVMGGSTYTGSGSFSKSGNTITGNFTLNPGALPYTFTATLNGTMQNANGTFSGTGSGSWAAQIKSGNLNQFIGNLDSGTWEWCGWRSGSSEPSPCQWP